MNIPLADATQNAADVPIFSQAEKNILNRILAETYRKAEPSASTPSNIRYLLEQLRGQVKGIMNKLKALGGSWDRIKTRAVQFEHGSSRWRRPGAHGRSALCSLAFRWRINSTLPGNEVLVQAARGSWWGGLSSSMSLFWGDCS